MVHCICAQACQGHGSGVWHWWCSSGIALQVGRHDDDDDDDDDGHDNDVDNIDHCCCLLIINMML